MRRNLSAAFAALCPSNDGLFTGRLAAERLPHWRLNFSVADANTSTRPLATMPSPRACTSATPSGRWIGSDWAPLSCYLMRYSRRMLQRCAERRPLRIELYGDSIMRGLYFDLAELLTEQALDRAWAKRHAGAGKGKRLTVEKGGVSISWAWWTLNATTHDTSDKRTPPPPSLANWSLSDRNAVVLFGSAAHNMRFGTMRAYDASLRGLVTELKQSHVHAKTLWLVGSANHVHDENLECTPNTSSPTHRMAFHRSLLFSAAGAEMLRGVTPLLDMYHLSANQADRCAKVHYDSLYVKEGVVSRAAANLLLNAACNSRLLPNEALTNGVV